MRGFQAVKRLYFWCHNGVLPVEIVWLSAQTEHLCSQPHDIGAETLPSKEHQNTLCPLFHFLDILDERDLRLISQIENGKQQWMIRFLSGGFNAIHIGRVYISGVGSHCQFSVGHATVPRAPVVAQHLMYPECSLGVPGWSNTCHASTRPYMVKLCFR